MSAPALSAARTALEAARDSLHLADLSWLEPEGERDAWTLADDTLRFLTCLLEHLRPRRVLEFGSGVSTRVLAAGGARPDGPASVTALENDPVFAARTVEALRGDGRLGRARVELTPVVVRRWYGRNLPVYHLPDSILEGPAPQLVLVDGPPLPLGGRAGSLLQAVHLAGAGTLVLLDDAQRDSEQAALALVGRLFPGSIEVELLDGFAKGLAAVVVREALDGTAMPPAA